jgi:hypothetical protein
MPTTTAGSGLPVTNRLSDDRHDTLMMTFSYLIDMLLLYDTTLDLLDIDTLICQLTGIQRINI